MKGLKWISLRKLALLAVIVPVLVLFGFVALRSGPLAPTPVTVVQVEKRSIEPAQFGVGTVEARYRYEVGPTAPGRLAAIHVDTGDTVKAGKLLADMDPVDLKARIQAQEKALQRMEPLRKMAEARIAEAESREVYTGQQLGRYAELASTQASSQEILDLKQMEHQMAQAALAIARSERVAIDMEAQSLESGLQALLAQKSHLRMTAPVDGLVVARKAEAGSTLVAGQTVVELVDPENLWIDVRFDQGRAGQLRAGQRAHVELRSRSGETLEGHLLRVEPLADSVTEEILARVVFEKPPHPLPPLGELVEVTVALPALDPVPTIPGASLHRVEGETGVWVVSGNELEFRRVRLGQRDLEGRIQILDGLDPGETVVEYSLQSLTARSQFKVVEKLSTGRRL